MPPLPPEQNAMLPRTECERLIYTLPTRYPSIRFSTLALAPPGLDIAQMEYTSAKGTSQ